MDVGGDTNIGDERVLPQDYLNESDERSALREDVGRDTNIGNERVKKPYLEDRLHEPETMTFKIHAMKILCIAVVSLFILSAAKCHKESENCHHTIAIRNNSARQVVIAFRSYHGDSCSLQGPVVNANDTYAYWSGRSCWEERANEVDPSAIYFVDPAHYNDPTKFYICDSVPLKNTTLKQFQVNTDELRNTNFIVTYP